MNSPPTTYVAVDTEALAHNLAQVRGLLSVDTKLMAVVKADAYGHGLTTAGEALLAAGADWLGVSRVDEGGALRKAGIEAPVLAFRPFAPGEEEAYVEYDLTATVVREEQVVGLAQAARAAGKVGRLQIYLDGGLGRPGAGLNLPKLIALVAGYPSLQLEGVYQHGGRADPGAESLLDVMRPGAEYELFRGLVQKTALQELGHTVAAHVAASAMTVTKSEAHLDMVRVGTLLYGQYPATVPQKARSLQLRRTLELRSTVLAVEELEPGTPVGYGEEFRCRRPTKVALLPVGYAAGLEVVPRGLARRRWGGWRGWARELVRGRERTWARLGDQRAPVVGRIAMDWCCLDVTDVPGVEAGTEVALPARGPLLDSALPRVPTRLD